MIFIRVAQKVDDLFQVLLGFIHPRHVVKADLRAIDVVSPRLAAPKAGDAGHTQFSASTDPEHFPRKITTSSTKVSKMF